MKQLTHGGEAHMVSVIDKADTKRVSVAKARVMFMNEVQ